MKKREAKSAKKKLDGIDRMCEMEFCEESGKLDEGTGISDCVERFSMAISV